MPLSYIDHKNGAAALEIDNCSERDLIREIPELLEMKGAKY